MPPTAGDVAKLETAHGATWTAIGQARRRAIDTRDELGRLVREARVVPQDTAFVVFGSLAREEVTEGSDVDWALLVDGPADDGHSSAVHRLRALLRDRKYKDPGTGGLFGGLAISHELVHSLHPEQARADASFQETRKIGNRFQDGLSALFFDSDEKLKDAVQRYGIF